MGWHQTCMQNIACSIANSGHRQLGLCSRDNIKLNSSLPYNTCYSITRVIKASTSHAAVSNKKVIVDNSSTDKNVITRHLMPS